MRAYYRFGIKNIIGQERVTEMIMWVTLFLLSPAELWSQLSADFNVNADIVCSGSSVTFTDNSGGTTDETQYLWNFGTGANPSSATGAGPHNVLYEGSGSSTVILTITQWPFDSDTDTGVIQIATLPETPTATVIQPGCITQSGTIVFNEQSDMEYSIAAGYQESEIFSGLIPGNYTLSVKNKDAPGCESFAESTITINAVPSPPEPIRGLASVCVGSTTQLLSSPSGGIWTSSNPSTVSVDNNGLVTGLLSGLTVISYTLGTDCSVSAEVSVISIPSQPEDFMVSSQEVCQGISDVAYSVPNDTGVTYNWNFSGSGVTITGTGNAVSLSFSAEASSGSLSVSASNSCGASIPRSTAITVLPGAPAQPGEIAGLTSQCTETSNQAYSISEVANANTYNWSLPSGWTIQSGAGSNIIIANIGENAQNGDIRVTAENNCGISAARSFAVSINTRSTAPTGVSVTNNNSCTGTSKTLAVTGGSLGSGARWQWYTGTCGGTPAGTGLSIIADPAAGTSTPYYARAEGICNTSPCANNIVVVPSNVGIPSTPTPSETTICQGSSSTSYTSHASNASSYSWTINGAGNTISGSGATAIVAWDSEFIGAATIRVIANGCGGPSQAATTTVTVRPTPTANISGAATVCQYANPPRITLTNPQALPVNITYDINGANPATLSVNANASVTLNAPTTFPGTFEYNLIRVAYQSGATCSNSLSGKTTIRVNPTPVPNLSSSEDDDRFCAGSNITFAAEGGTHYNFRIGTVSVQNGPANTFTTNQLTNGQRVSVVVTNISGCTTTSPEIINYVDPIPFISVSSNPVCAANLNSYSLSVAASPGTLTSTYGTVTYDGNNIWTISRIHTERNTTIKITDENTCENKLEISAPDCSCPTNILAPVSGGDKSFCISGTVPVINAIPLAGETVDWYNAASAGDLLSQGTLNYTPPAAGTFYAQTRNITTNCTSSTRTAVIVTLLPLPTANAGSSAAAICQGGNTSVLGGSVGGSATGGQWSSSAGGTFNPNNTSLNASWTPPSGYSGTATLTLTSSGGTCGSASSSKSQVVTPLPTANPGPVAAAICQGETSAGLGGQIGGSATGGIWSTVAGGTFTPGTTSLNARWVPPAGFNGSAILTLLTSGGNCGTASANKTQVVAPLPLANAGAETDPICQGEASVPLGGSIGGSATGGIWSSPTGGVFAPNAQSLDARWTPPEGFSGTATLTLTTSGGNCGTASASKAQTVNAIPETNAGKGGAACDLAFALNAIPSIGSGIWTQTEGPGTSMFTPDPNSPAVTVNASEYGRYTYKWSETNVNCSNSSELIVEYFKRPDINPGTGGNNCGLEYNMNGSTDVGSGTWSLVSGPGNASFSPDTSARNALVSVSDYGDYVFSWKVVNGACSDSARVNVNFVKQVSADAGEGGVGCDMRFSLEGIGTYGVGTWTKVKGGGNVVFTPDNHQPDAVVTVDKIGEYEFAWTVENIACNSTDIINIEFHDSPIVNAGSDTLICKGSNISLSAQGIGSFFWKPEDLVTAPDVPDPQTTPTETTRFFVTLTDAAGCENSDEILVEVREKPIAFAGPDQDLDYLFETNLKADNPIIYETGNWEVLSGSGRAAYPTLSETSVSNLSVGENKFTWTVTNDVCPSASDTVSIRVRDLLIPTLITPNNDGENDNFVIKGITALGKTELIVFDRRGLEVYRNNNYNNEWNGEDYKGIQLPDDTYFFIVRPENGTPVSNYLVIRRQR